MLSIKIRLGSNASGRGAIKMELHLFSVDKCDPSDKCSTRSRVTVFCVPKHCAHGGVHRRESNTNNAASLAESSDMSKPKGCQHRIAHSEITLQNLIQQRRRIGRFLESDVHDANVSIAKSKANVADASSIICFCDDAQSKRPAANDAPGGKNAFWSKIRFATPRKLHLELFICNTKRSNDTRPINRRDDASNLCSRDRPQVSFQNHFFF